MKSKNIVFTEPRVAALVEQDVPEMGDSQILVRAEHSLISTGTELICFNGEFEPGTHWDQWVKFPFKPGYCMVGSIEKVGAEVSRFAPGERVALRANHKEWTVWDAKNHDRVVSVPEGVKPDDAPWFGMGCIAQIGVRRAQHQLGDAVAIIGAGLLGQLVTQYVRLMGAREIIMIDTAPARLELAKQHGATQVLDMTADKAREAVYDLTSGNGADVVYDITGHPLAFQPALGLARRFGKLLLLGDTPRPGQQCLTLDVVTRGVQIIGAHDSMPPHTSSDYEHWTHIEMSQLFFNYLQREQMRVADLVTHRYKPKQAPQAYSDLLKDRSTALGVIFDW